MQRSLHVSRSSIVVFTIVCLCIFLNQCINSGSENAKQVNAINEKFEKFSGSAACASCHKNIYDSFTGTGHFLTSQIADERNIKGNFEKGHNTFNYSPELFVAMEKRDSGLYEVEYLNGKETTALRIGITVGSGMRGQSYITWQHNHLFQLPVSFLTSADSWANSPGDLNHVVFNRVINSRCLECHSTYADVISSPLINTQEEFDHDKILYGIGCEKCHGAGAQHIAYETQHLNEPEGKYIINPAKFSRQQSLDLCSLCHGGKLGNLKPAFSFTAGDNLQNYFIIDNFSNNAGIDVHGNQFGLLAKSKCFRISSTMTCITCHSPHTDNRDNVALFSQKCMACHNKEHGTFCKIKDGSIATISSNCIDCHMPKQISRSIVLQLQDHKTPTAELLRTHLIAVYRGATKKFLADE